jgi:phosphoglycerate dehydrogenase-like enzyme
MASLLFLVLPDLLETDDLDRRLRERFDEIRVCERRENAIPELMELGPRVDAVIVGVRERITGDVLSAVPNLQVVGSVGAGTDHLDLVALQKAGVAVVTTPGANATSVAEHALFMILGLIKRGLRAHAAVLAGADRSGIPQLPLELSGSSVGVLGAGPTARALVGLLRPFDVDLRVWTRSPQKHPDLPVGPLERVFEARAVSIHLPLTAETRGLVGADLLRRLPPDAVVVNTARKEIVDPKELRIAVQSRPDLNVAVDDFDLKRDGTIDALDDFRGLWSPHIAGVTVQSLRRMHETVVTGLLNAIGPVD